MMTNEGVFEKDYLVKFFTDELHYKHVSNNLYHDGEMLYREGLKDFLLRTQLTMIKEVVKFEYSGDESAFWDDFFGFVSQQVYYKHNVCIKLNKGVKFKGKYAFYLYEAFDDFSEDRNDYAIMAQLPVNRGRKADCINIIPDIGIFVNGILFSYMELKFNNTRQTAKENGRKKILSDYSECVGDHVYPIYNNNMTQGEKNEIIFQKLKLFHSPAFIVSLDNQEAYVIRNIRDLFGSAISDYKSGKGISKKTMIEGLRDFHLDSVFTKNDPLYQTNSDKVKRFLTLSFAKRNVRDEIKILNTLVYSRTSGGKVKDNTAKLLTPRPNQKYGYSSLIEKVESYYANENNEAMLEKNERARLKREGAPDIIIEDAIAAQKKYKNNREVYSLLLQYSTGFGKTFVCCASALGLKNLKDSDNKFLFDKIFLISDRIDLRDQIASEMTSMNIDKALFMEPQNKKQFKEALESNKTRVVIVNIQKFNFIKDFLEKEKQDYMKENRIAFIIDEVHRSNSGSMHDSMLSIFDDVEAIANQGKQRDKKNLIIALTATPTEENLGRFGELCYVNGRAVWTPFDSYTLKSAIEDGFVLNPVQSILFYSYRLYFEEKECAAIPSNKDIYSSEKRIDECVERVIQILFDVTYNKISKQGKGMLCCYSIEIANMYHEKLLMRIEEKAREKGCSDSEIEELKGMILMVYTPSQETGQPAHKRCGMKNEEEVIRKFKDGKNGLMIVVDKLQTGFNEPKLHTLFLDKEIQGINCIQTISRVNRTMTNKDDCLIVDFSYNSANKDNIKSAFNYYEGELSSTMSFASVEEKIIEYYKKIQSSEYYKLYFNDKKRNIDRALQKGEYIKNALEDKAERMILNELYKNMAGFIKGLKVVRNVMYLDDKYLDKDLESFIKEFMNLVYVYTSTSGDSTDGFDEIIVDEGGFIVDEESSTFIPERVKKDNKEATISFASTGISSLDEILRLNENEEAKSIKIDEFRRSINCLFDIMHDSDKHKNNFFFYRTLKDESKISDEYYDKIYRIAKRQIKDPDLKKFILYIEKVRDFVKADYVRHVMGFEELY